MERLRSLLTEYIQKHSADFHAQEWTKAFTICPYPTYWQVVFTIAESLPNKLSVLEIGAGFGFITSIFKYLGFKDVACYEQDGNLCRAGNRMLKELFDSDECIKPERFDMQERRADILVLVNCSYADECQNKQEYKSRLMSYYYKANEPKFYILEVIDSCYREPDELFPDCIRLSCEDINQMFPNSKITSWPTYRYPHNKKSKTLYLIEKK